VHVQSLSTPAKVTAGHKASFVVWVWSTKAAAAGISVHVALGSALHLGAPRFTVCPHLAGATCTIGNLPVGQADELQVAVQVQPSAVRGEHVRITAKASAAGAKSFAASATDVVEVNRTASRATRSTSPTRPSSAPVQLPVPGPVPTLSGTAVSPTDPSALFPTVGASPTTGTGSLGLPPARPRAVLHAATAADTVPLDARLLGGQLAGLAVLAGAVTIAITRLSLRKPKATDGAEAKQPPEQ
jgi:hypothetical protein